MNKKNLKLGDIATWEHTIGGVDYRYTGRVESVITNKGEYHIIVSKIEAWIDRLTYSRVRS